LLRTHRGRFDRGALLQVASSALQSPDEASVAWGARLAREHLDCRSATAAFKACGLRQVHSAALCDEKTRYASGIVALQATYLEHLLRCAGSGLLAEALALGIEGTTELPASTTHTFMCTRKSSGSSAAVCRVAHVEPLVLGEAAAPGLAVALASAGGSRGQHQEAAEVFLRMPAGQLARVLTEEVLLALGPWLPPVVAGLAERGAEEAAGWATPARLAVLPPASRTALCAALWTQRAALSAETAAEAHIGKLWGIMPSLQAATPQVLQAPALAPAGGLGQQVGAVLGQAA